VCVCVSAHTLQDARRHTDTYVRIVHTDRQTDRHSDTQKHRHTDTDTDTDTDTETDTHTVCVCVVCLCVYTHRGRKCAQGGQSVGQ